jgi:ketosteroid isomerase-like protein
MRGTIVAGVAAGVLALGTFSATAVAGPKEDMIATDKAFAAMSVEKGRHAAFLAYMADDVKLFDGDHPPIEGKAAVEAYYAKHPEGAGTRLEWTPAEADASPDGRLGWTRGTWVFTAKTTDGSEAKVTGYYVTVWRRQADGHYRFTLDIGGADPKPKAD